MEHKTSSTIIFLLLFFLPNFSHAQNIIPCPLDFTILTTLSQRSTLSTATNTTTRCQYLRQGLRLVLSEHLRITNTFLPPLNSSEPCWNAYQISVNDYFPDFDILQSCPFQRNWLVQGSCMNITTTSEFESHVQPATLERVYSSCNQSLDSSACSECITSIVNLQASSFNGDGSVNDISDCASYATMYGAGIVNPNGPANPGTAGCLFKLVLTTPEKSNRKRKIIVVVVSVTVSVVVLSFVLVVVVLILKRKRELWEKIGKIELNSDFSGLELISESSNLVKFSFDEIKIGAGNFSKENIIGTGRYGNVYKGVLRDGTEVALKRFKNLSVVGDEAFASELEMIASVRHVNLVGLRGYCTGTTEVEGHQRIIVYDLMKNGSLFDHLFMARGGKLSWPLRRKIALGTAQGLAYLHSGVQPAIIHRDIKASNILLDDKFEPKVGDFGLAKFTPEGRTHLSTNVAGTLGYVAPEYALYGQVSERSDVYSFGVVLLQLLSGRKAIMAGDDGQLTLLSDWGWSMVKEGRAFDMIEGSMVDLDPPDVMEKYISIAILCSHPHLYARPTMTDVVKLLDTSIPVPAIPDRPSLFIDVGHELEKSPSSAVSGTSMFTSYSDEPP